MRLVSKNEVASGLLDPGMQPLAGPIRGYQRMKHVKKIIAAVVVVAIVAVAAAFLWIDRLAKVGVERGATYALGVRTRLADMDVGVLSGRVAMGDLSVANPEGFSSDSFLELGKGEVSVSLGTLMEEKVVLPTLKLADLHLNLERNGSKANYDEIINNLKKLESKSARPAEESEGKRFVIQDVDIRNVNVNVQVIPLGGELTRIPISIEEIQLSDIGSDSDNGVVLAQLTGILMKAVLQAVVAKAGNVLPADVMAGLTAGLDQLDGIADTTIQVVGQVVTDVQNVSKGLQDTGRQIGEKLNESTKGLGKGLNDAGKELENGIGGLLKGDKKKDGGD